MRALVLVVVLATPAHADEELHEHSSLLDKGPQLDLDPVFRPALEGLGAASETERKVVPIGKHARAVFEGTWWANADNDVTGQRAVDFESRGWRAGVRVERDLGFATLALHASLNHVDVDVPNMPRYELGGTSGPPGSGTYYDVGVALFRKWRLSRWMTAWISLDVGQRVWLGTPPAGEQNDTRATLSIGTTFK